MPIEQPDNTDTNPSAEGGGGKDKTDKTRKVLELARKRRRMCESAESDNRVAAKADLLFLAGGDNQWDPQAVTVRRRDGLPVITVNVLPAFMHQITNDQRMNTPSIKVHPVGDGADQETAKVRQGMIRHIEYDSNADVAYDTAVNSAAGIGFGYFRIMPEYVSDDSDEQKLCFKRIRNALTVRIDPLAQEADGSDMKFCFIEELMDKDEFKEKYPDANAAGGVAFFSADANAYSGWWSDQTVTVAEYYSIEEEDDEFVRLSDGSSGLKSKLEDLNGEKVQSSRKVKRKKIIWRKITGADVLEETEIKCKWIPVFPVYGDELDIEGKVIRSGMVRNAKGPCQSYNVMMSGATAHLAMSPKAPLMMAEGQEEGHEDELAEMNLGAPPYLLYKPTTVGDKLAPPPQRLAAPDMPASYLMMCAEGKENIMRTTGMFQASIGQKGTATSGKQEIAQQREGDVANFHFLDNLNKAVRHAGRCLNCMIPNYYDTERVVKIIRDDESAGYAKINQQIPMDQQQPDPKTGAVRTVLNDMTCGEYDVTITAGPSYTTMRQENQELFTSAMQASKDPAQSAIFGYLAIRNTDAPGADLATKMIKTVLPPPAQAVLDEENGDKEPQPMVLTPQGPVPAAAAGQLIADLMMQLEQAGEALKKADGAKQQAEALKQRHLLQEQELEPARQAVEMKKFDAEIAKADAEKAKAAAAVEQAKADIIRAQAEAQCAPQKAEAEVYTAKANEAKAQNDLRQPIPDPDKAQAEKDAMDSAAMSKLAEKIIAARPKGADLVITAPSGLNYEVKATLH